MTDISLLRWGKRLYWLGVRPRHISLVALLGLLAVFAEGFTIGMVLPVFDYINANGDVAALVEKAWYWRHIERVYSALGGDITLGGLMVPIFLLIIARQLVTYARQWYCARVLYDIILNLQQMVIRSVVRADCLFLQSTNTGAVLNAATMDAQRAGSAAQFFFEFIAMAAIFAGYVGVMVVVSGWVVFIALALMAGIGYGVRSFMHQGSRSGKEISELNAELQRRLIESIEGIRIIKSCDRESFVLQRIDAALERLKDRSVHLVMVLNGTRFVVEPAAMLFLMAGIFIAVRWFGVPLIQLGVLSLVFIRLVPIARSVLETRQKIANQLPSLDSIERLIGRAETACTITGGSKTLPRLRKGFAFEGVALRYPGAGQPALDDLDLVLEANRMTALVGRSGAGKSTLIHLLMRLIDPTEGRILADGEDLKTFSLESLRAAIALVPQEGQLFDASVEENIRFGNPNASDAEIEEAARLAHAHDFILRLPQGYRSSIGERGERLSVGQRQRIALARALAKKAQVLILDEPTSALDSETEQGIQNSLEHLRSEGKTTIIVIAHRLSTIHRADCIVVMEQGRVRETGTHAALMHNEEWYARMMSLQSAPPVQEAADV